MVSSENITELESMKIIFLFPLYDLLSLPSLPLESHSLVILLFKRKFYEGWHFFKLKMLLTFEDIQLHP